MARFWAVPVFCNEVWTVWSAYTTADYIQHGLVQHTAWSTTRAGQPQGLVNHKSPLDNGEIFLYSCSWLVGQRNRCWIKGLGTNPQKEWAWSLLAVPFFPGSPKRDPLDSEKMAWISRIMPQNVHFTVGKSFACIHVNRRKVVKWIYLVYQFYEIGTWL